MNLHIHYIQSKHHYNQLYHNIILEATNIHKHLILTLVEENLDSSLTTNQLKS